jgi:hypothetical protein
MAQSLSAFKKIPSTALRFSDIDPSKYNPDLAALALDVIATWSHVDGILLHLYLTLLVVRPGVRLEASVDKGNSPAAIVFMSIESHQAKRYAIKNVAEKTVTTKHFHLLGAVLAVAKNAARARNAVAHGIWGYTEKLPDALLLTNPKNLYRGTLVSR